MRRFLSGVALAAVSTPSVATTTSSSEAPLFSANAFFTFNASPGPSATPVSSSSDSLTTVAVPTTFLGPLPTTFIPPTDCQTPFVSSWSGYFEGVQVLYGAGQSCNGVDQQCFPSNLPYSDGPEYNMAIFSPASGCPSSWYAACEATSDADDTYTGMVGLGNWMSKGQTLQLCCPIDWICGSGNPTSGDILLYFVFCALPNNASSTFAARTCVADSSGGQVPLTGSGTFETTDSPILGYAPAIGILSNIEEEPTSLSSLTTSADPLSSSSFLSPPAPTYTPPLILPTSAVNDSDDNTNHEFTHLYTILFAALGGFVVLLLGMLVAFLLFRNRKKDQMEQLKVEREGKEQEEIARREQEAQEREQEIRERVISGIGWIEGHPLIDLSNESESYPVANRSGNHRPERDFEANATSGPVSPFLEDYREVAELSGTESRPRYWSGTSTVDK